MGLESQCRAWVDGKESEGRVLLETNELVFRGAFRLAIPLTAIRAVEARDVWLEIRRPEGLVRFELGRARATRWAEKIRNPPSLLDKLGVKAGLRVAVAGLEDKGFYAQVAQRTPDVSRGLPRRTVDLVVLGVEDKSDLRRIATARRRLEATGAIWVVWPKGRPALREDDVRAAAKEAGLVDVKVASFSPTLSALKLMVPRARR